jgi:3-isopropylmalate/(R)-2-methylmalate dehydratase small subunit
MGKTVSMVQSVAGRAIPIKGNDIDTDRIIPARYLRAITFEGLGEHAFEDDRKSDPNHSFNQAQFQGARLLIANGNFGCGSSREHAPQALQRWGIQAVVAESFAEIFQGNCTAMGVPCLTGSTADVHKVQNAIAKNPSLEFRLDLKTRKLSCDEFEIDLKIPDGNRLQLIEGAWDATGMLLEGAEATRDIAEKLPYVVGF